METKNEILERLIREGHLKLDEALVLLDKDIPHLANPLLPWLYPSQPLEPYYGDGFKIVCKDVDG